MKSQSGIAVEILLEASQGEGWPIAWTKLIRIIILQMSIRRLYSKNAQLWKRLGAMNLETTLSSVLLR